MKKIFIVGKNGFIAKKLLERDTYKTMSSNKKDTSSLYLDLKKAEELDYSIFDEKSKIILLAAISSPDECNNNYEESYKINVTGTKYFIKEAIKRDAKVLFFSSDVVYGNTTEKVDENSLTNPFGSYAKMKNEIEEIFKDEANFKVFRLSYVLSKEDKYLSYLQSCVEKNEIAEVFHPFNRKVVFIEDVLEAIENIIDQWDEFSNQKFNICGNEDISKKDMADFYKKITRYKLQYSIIEPNSAFWEARPKDINMQSLYLEKLLNKKPIKIEDAIYKILQGEQ